MTYHDSISINSHSDKAIPVQCVPYSRRTSLTPVSHENALNIWWWIRKRKCCQLMSDNTLIGQTMIFYGSWLSTITEEFFPLTWEYSVYQKLFFSSDNCKPQSSKSSKQPIPLLFCSVIHHLFLLLHSIQEKSSNDRREWWPQWFHVFSTFICTHTHTHAMFIQQPTRNNNILSL